VAPRFKNLLRLEAGYPALRCHSLKQNTGHTHNTHNTGTCHNLKQNAGHTHNTHNTGTTTPPNSHNLNKTQVTRTTHTTQEPPNLEEGLTPQGLEKIPPGFGLVGIIIRDRNNFSARDKRPGNQQAAQTGVRSRRTSCTRSSSSRVKGTRRRRLSHLQQLAAGGPAARAAPAAVR